ncbi:MAG: NAD(P)H-dependent flavin oxidoreductase [Lachnospirales bacterium]
MKSLEIGNIKLKYPIIQGGMGVGVSLSNLASSVTLAGGLGVISAAQIGYLDPLFKKNPIEANLKALKEHILIAKEKALGGPIGVNIMVAQNMYEEYVKCAISSGVDIIISGAGLPMKLPQLVKNTGVKIAPIVSSLKAARVILKRWEKKDDITCDMLVVENHKAGGHLGFKKEDIIAYENAKNFDDEFKNIVEYVKEFEVKFNKEVPVIYAGGVFDKNDIEHCLSIGANGVQMATRFVPTYECDASEEFKQAYISAKKEDVKLCSSPVGLPGRAIANKFTKSSIREDINKCYKCLAKCDIKTIPYCITDRLIRSVKGDVDNGLVFCGSNAYRCDKIMSVKDLMAELTQ